MSGFRRRRTLLVGIAGLAIALLAGCGGSGSNNAATPTAAPSASPSLSPSPSPAVKQGPAKIVVTYFPYADHLFALGKGDTLQGVVNLKSLQDFTVYDPFLKGKSVADLGDTVNLEKFMALEPDLIIASSNEAQYADQLAKIARTVTVPATLNWQDTIKGVAAAIGEEAKAEEYTKRFLAKQAEVAAALDKAGAKGKTAFFMMPWKKGFTYWSNSRMALYYEKLGFKMFEGLQNVGEITLEGVAKLDPAYIFIGKDYTNTSEITIDSLKKDPVWNSLSAVKNNRMFVVDTEILGPLAMGQMKGLDYMKQQFGK